MEVHKTTFPKNQANNSNAYCYKKKQWKKITVPKIICNEVNDYFVKIGEKLGVQMTNTNDKTYINFMGKLQVSFVYL